MLLTPLEQFQVISIFPIKLLFFDFSFTNMFLINVLVLVIISFIVSCFGTTSSFMSIQKSYLLIQNAVLNLSILIMFFVCYLIIKDPINVQELGSFNNSFITGILSLFWVVMCKTYIMKQKFNNFEYILLVLFSVLGMFILCSSNDLITAYLMIELQSLSFYVLASYKKNSTFSVESGIKYFILGSFASSLFLFGSSLLYGLTGTVNFEDFKDLFSYFSLGSVESISLKLSQNLVQYIDILESLKPVLAEKIIADGDCIRQFPGLFEVEVYKNSLNSFTDKLTQYIIILSNVSYLLSYLILNFNLDFLLDSYSIIDKNHNNSVGLDEDYFLVLFSELEILNYYVCNDFTFLQVYELELIKFSLLLIIASFFLN